MQRIVELETELKQLRKIVRDNNKPPKPPVDKNKPQKRYIQQKCQADHRGIGWLFTFDTWWKMWEESGKWNERGRKTGQYCMARKGDIGPYSPENVDIILVTKNSSDAHANNRVTYGTWKPNKEQIEAMRIRATGVKQSEETRKKKSLANKGKGWSEARRAAHKAAWNKGLTKATDARVANYADNYPENRKSKLI